MTVDKRRIAACLKACEGISTQNLEDNVPILELARRYNVVLRERDALRAKIEQMERQKPTYWGPKHAIDGGSTTVIVGRSPVNPTDAPLYALPGAQPAQSINEGVRKVTLGFRWESEAQHHIPTIEIEFDPVSPDSPNDAKGWQDRDRIASMLSPEAKP